MTQSTRRLNQLILGALLTVSWIASWAQLSEDSTRLYSAPIWKVRQLANITIKAKECDSLVIFQEQTIQSGIKLQADTDSLLSISRQETRLAKLDLRDSTALLGMYLTEEKTKRKRNGLTRDAALIAVAFLIYLAVKP